MNEPDYAAFLAHGHYAALNEHLLEVRPIMDEFCAQNGFVYVDRKSLGRYPSVRIERPGSITLWFDLRMEDDKEGNRFEEFRRDIPYELNAGAYIEMPDGSRDGIRYSKYLVCFSGKPFREVGAVLCSEMEKYLPIVDKWDAQYLTSVAIEFPNGRDWFLVDWIFQQLAEDVIKASLRNMEVEDAMKKAQARRGLFLRQGKQYALKKDLAFEICRLMKGAVEDSAAGKLGDRHWFPDDEVRRQTYVGAMTELRELMLEDENHA